MIPDVPRSLREQLKKENMMLMEFLLNQDQEAQAKSHSQKGPNPCFPASLDIIVEAPAMGQEEEEEVPGEVEVILNDLRSSGDSDPEVGRSDRQPGEEQGGKERDDTAAAEEEEQRKDADDINEGVKGNGVHKNEDEKEERREIIDLEPAEDFTVDLDQLMSELGLLGERRRFILLYFVLLSFPGLYLDDLSCFSVL